MAPRRAGILALALIGLSAALSVYAVARPTAPRSLAGPVDLPLTAPLPTSVPPDTQLVIGDPQTEQVLRHTGWIKELPFKVQWAEIVGGPAVTEAFHAKALDVGAVANIPPIHAVWVGMPVKMIAIKLRADPVNHPVFQLAIAPGVKIDSLADLRGKRIAYSPGQIQGELVIRSLEYAGLRPRDVKLVELPSTSADVYLNALAGGELDAAPIGAGPAVKRYLERYGAKGAKVIPHGPRRDDLSTLFVRDETLHDPAKAAALRAYIKLWGRAQAWINAPPEEWAKLYYEQKQGLSPELATYAVRAIGGTVVPTQWDEMVAYQQASIDLMSRISGRKAFPADTIFDRRFERIGAEGFAQYQTGAVRLAAR